jgi:ubiquinol-cytochrome c reductase cytochrome c subunit
VSRGAELYRLNCAACHVASGAGAVIGSGRTAPALTEATPTQVGEAILVGPGAMPVFGALSDRAIDDIAAYVLTLQEEGTTGAGALGGVGPVAEGLAAWLLGVLPLVALCRWIGSPHEDEEAQAAPGEAPERTTA